MTLEEAKQTLDIVIPATWDKWTNKRILTLHPLIRYAFACAVIDCEKRLAERIRLTCGGRSFDDQDRLYGFSRTEQMLETRGVNPKYAKPNEKWRTNAKGGESYHNYFLAGDICIISDDGKNADFNITPEIARVFKKYGFEWLYDRMGKDKPHFQITFGYNYSQLKALQTDVNGFKIFQQ